MRAIYFDMDGTIANLYGEENWLDNLIHEYTKPYRNAKPMVNMRELGRTLNALKAQGYAVGIVSWLSKCGTEDYNARVTKAKRDWLARHIGAVQFDEVHIVPYGTPKETVVRFNQGILFDDEEQNRKNWTGTAYDVQNILETLNALLQAFFFCSDGEHMCVRPGGRVLK